MEVYWQTPLRYSEEKYSFLFNYALLTLIFWQCCRRVNRYFPAPVIPHVIEQVMYFDVWAIFEGKNINAFVCRFITGVQIVSDI
ncbi:hypothetical protein C1Y41_17250 [Pantoea sp. ICBG 1758]|nr:hypothetical protein C1Y41_17250 [Pantoea sp. ICBG 1758]